MNLHEQAREKILALEAAILAANPRLPVLLKDIHDFLKTQPDIVTVLTEEEILPIVRGLEIQTNTSLAEASAKKEKASKAKKVAAITEDDL